MAKRRETVGASAVREHFGMPLNQRGRLSADLIAKFESETGKRVQTGFKPVPTVTVAVTKVDAKGRKRTRQVEKPLAEVREKALALGVGGERGVLSAKAIAAVGEALSDPTEAPASE